MDDSTANSMSSSQELDMSSNGDSYQGKTQIGTSKMGHWSHDVFVRCHRWFTFF